MKNWVAEGIASDVNDFTEYGSAHFSELHESTQDLSVFAEYQ